MKHVKAIGKDTAIIVCYSATINTVELEEVRVTECERISVHRDS